MYRFASFPQTLHWYKVAVGVICLLLRLQFVKHVKPIWLHLPLTVNRPCQCFSPFKKIIQFGIFYLNVISVLYLVSYTSDRRKSFCLLSDISIFSFHFLADIERYSDKYQSQVNDNQWVPNWKYLPKELNYLRKTRTPSKKRGLWFVMSCLNCNSYMKVTHTCKFGLRLSLQWSEPCKIKTSDSWIEASGSMTNKHVLNLKCPQSA